MAAIAKRYAKALADVSFQLKLNEKVGQELIQFEQLLASNRELHLFYTNPAVPLVRKKAATTEILNQLKFSQVTSNFIFILIDKHRMGYFEEICKAFQAAVNERLGVVEAQVTTARDLNETAKSGLESSLARLTGKKVNLKFGMDRELIGGIITRIGDTIYDGSVRQQLNLIKSRLSSE